MAERAQHAVEHSPMQQLQGRTQQLRMAGGEDPLPAAIERATEVRDSILQIMLACVRLWLPRPGMAEGFDAFISMQLVAVDDVRVIAYAYEQARITRWRNNGRVKRAFVHCGPCCGQRSK